MSSHDIESVRIVEQHWLRVKHIAHAAEFRMLIR